MFLRFYWSLWMVLSFKLKLFLFKPLKSSSKVLLISIDGFRWDMRNKTFTPYLDAIVKHGVTSGYVKNVFPTSTFPNHQSVVTGLYPENHGIIDNTFLDESGKIFKGTEGDTRIEMWNQSIPIWTVNEMQGHKSGVIFWPGYRVKYNNKLPSYIPSYKYDLYRSNYTMMNVTSRIDLALSWLKKKDVNLVLLYTEGIDDVAHNYGPDSDNAVKEIKSVDRWLKYLATQLVEQNLSSDVNVILLGDHGHVETSYEKNIHLDDYIDTAKDVRYIGTFTNVFIYPKAGRTEYIYKKLKKAIDSHYTVYLKKDIPSKYHIKNNNHTAEILLLPDPGWTVTCKFNYVPYLQGKWERADHGYGNEHRIMNPAFFAFGPAFREGYRKNVIHSVDVYSLISHILKIKPRENDGKFDRIKSILNESQTDEED